MKLNTKNLKDVEIGIPLITEGVYHARITALVKPNKTQTGNNLEVKIVILDNPVVSYGEGKEIRNNGQIVALRYVSLVPTENYDPDKAIKELAVAVKHPEDQDLQVEDLQQKLVMVKIKHKNEEKDPNTGKTYPAGNEVARFTPVPDGDTFQAPPF